MIIDFHTHTFPEGVSQNILEKLSCSGNAAYFTKGSVSALCESMKQSGVSFSVNLPVMTRENQVRDIHNNLLNLLEDLKLQHIITFGGMHPFFDDYRDEIKRIKSHGIKGIKIHPAFYDMDINDIRIKRIIEAASLEDMVIVTHAGEDISFPGQNHASVMQILDVIDDVSPGKFVLAHMGGWQNWKCVKEYIAGADVWLDTSFSLGEYYPRAGMEKECRFTYNLNRNDFAGLVKAHGADKILFATDSPWAPQKDYIDFINSCDLDEDDRKLIFGANACRLLGIDYEQSGK